MNSFHLYFRIIATRSGAGFLDARVGPMQKRLLAPPIPPVISTNRAIDSGGSDSRADVKRFINDIPGLLNNWLVRPASLAFDA